MMDWRENPLLRRELLYRLRPSPSHRSLIAAVVVLGLVTVALLYWTALENMRGLETYRDLLILTLVVETLLVVGGAPAATANAVSREREQRTWELLTITLLRPHEVVLGKLLGRTIPLFLLLLLGVPMIAVCVIAEPQLLPGAFLGTLCVLVTLVFYSTAGLAASCFSRKTVTATVLAYLFAGGWVFGTLILWGLTSLILPGVGDKEAAFWLAVNPFAVIEPLMVKYTPSRYGYSSDDMLYVLSPWALLVVYSGLTVLLLWALVSTYRHWAYR
jgi:ABC-type transport system involved in multi-copper enzyme maturation permease subunit